MSDNLTPTIINVPMMAYNGCILHVPASSWMKLTAAVASRSERVIRSAGCSTMSAVPYTALKTGQGTNSGRDRKRQIIEELTPVQLYIKLPVCTGTLKEVNSYRNRHYALLK